MEANAQSLLSLTERHHFRQQFSMSIANLAHMAVYWSPGARRILVRSVACVRRFKLPEDAVAIGIFAHPYPAVDFIDELNDFLRVAAHAKEDGGL